MSGLQRSHRRPVRSFHLGGARRPERPQPRAGTAWPPRRGRRRHAITSLAHLYWGGADTRVPVSVMGHWQAACPTSSRPPSTPARAIRCHTATGTRSSSTWPATATTPSFAETAGPSSCPTPRRRDRRPRRHPRAVRLGRRAIEDKRRCGSSCAVMSSLPRRPEPHARDRSAIRTRACRTQRANAQGDPVRIEHVDRQRARFRRKRHAGGPPLSTPSDSFGAVWQSLVDFTTTVGAGKRARRHALRVVVGVS